MIPIVTFLIALRFSKAARKDNSEILILDVFRGKGIPWIRRLIASVPRNRRWLQAIRIDPAESRSYVLIDKELEVRTSNAESPSSTATGDYPYLGFHEIENATILSNPRLAFVVADGKVLLPKPADDGPWDLRAVQPVRGGLLRQDGDRLLVEFSREERNWPNGIYVGTWSPHNWYHWLIDTLPSVYLSQFLPKKYRDWPIILPELIASRVSWLEPLLHVLGDRPVIYLAENEVARFSKVVWIDSPTSPGPVPAGNPRGAMFRAHKTALNAFREALMSSAGFPESCTSPNRKIFIARSPTLKRKHNQPELLDIALERGFEPIFFENHTLKETIQIVSEAKSIIGPHGAGWANAIFSNLGISALLWTAPSERHNNWFANIGSIREMNLKVAINTDSSVPPFGMTKRRFVELLNELEG